MKSEYFFTVVQESDLNELLEGREAGNSVAWEPSNRQRIKAGSMGLVWKKQQNEKGVQPLLIVVQEKELRRLYGRLAQLRSDLSPLTAWCHVITPERFKNLDSMVRIPDLAGLEAAWTGLIVSEAQLLAERPVTNLRISACFATQTFAIARTFALWGDISISDVLERFDSVNRLFRAGVPEHDRIRSTRLRAKLLPIWTSLAALSGADNITSELQPVVESLRALKDARYAKDKNESGRFVAPLMESVPEVQALENLRDVTPERRLQLFDRLIDSLEVAEEKKEPIRQVALPLVAGYLATVAAGGSSSLSLTEGFVGRWPEITAWAYVIGGIGEPVVWTSGFDGLGRFVARELMRPFRFDESPTCDLAFDEGAILIDTKLQDPLVHLKIKQARILTVALLPGVYIFLPISDTSSPPIKKNGNEGINRQLIATTTLSDSESDPSAILADKIWPYIQSRVEAQLKNYKTGQSKSKSKAKVSSGRGHKKKTSLQEDLPLDSNNKKQ